MHSSAQPKSITLIAGILLVIIFPQACSLLLRFSTSAGLLRLVISRGVFCADVLLLIWYARRIERQPLLLWTETLQPFSFYLKWGFLLYLMAYAASALSYIPVKFGMPDNHQEIIFWGNIISSRWWLIFVCAATAGVTEELLIRGYIQPRLEVLFKNGNAAVVVSALLFSGMHYAYFNWRELIFTFLFGLIFGWHYRKHRNIKVLIVVHFLVDLVSFSLWRFISHHPELLHRLTH